MFTEEESHGHVRFNVLGKLPENIHVPGGTSAIETRKSSQGNVRAYGAVNWFDLPPVKPSAIAIGTAFNAFVSGAVLAPVFGDAYNRAQAANTKEEFFKSREAATAAASYGSSVLGAAVQTYGIGALINATGTLSYKGAAYLGALVFFASSAPGIISQIATEKRPLDTVAVGAVSRVFETVGTSLLLTYWGTRTNPFD
ncbi:MAG: hypothetical protein GOMPHAMPRED_007183 [Gomphillus americanus]|uniref:DUF1761-domain-containing protein n=1 Tax=Gomphillus americanus TaxID=1940652 RepID=A0A8H3EQF7_9LECA|nr:MAG: hypothetical protein GOMPHAMPRED_007183 [Gomphillus americanus]